MKKNLKLKPFVLPSVYLLIILLLVASVFLTTRTMKKTPEEDLTYVSGSIFGTTVPVLNEEVKIIRPYTSDQVKEAKYFYDYQAEQAKQENALIYHENTYMQNSGMDFTMGEAQEAFDVVAVLDGTVVSVKEDDLLGKIIEIRHNNDLISVYQSLGEVTVAKDDEVKQGQVIGKTGTNELDAALKNHLHFELFHKGQVVNPENYFDKNPTEEQGD